MFLPLLQMMNETAAPDPASLGNLKFLVDLITVLGFKINILSVLVFIFLFFVLKAIIVFLNDLYAVRVKLFFTNKIRIESLNNLNQMSYKSFVLSDVGQIQNSLTGEVDKITKAFDAYYVTLQQAIMVAVYMGFAVFIDVQFAVLVSIGGVLSNLIYKKIYIVTKNSSYKLTKDTNNFQGLIIQHVTNFKYLKATGLLVKYGKKLVEGVNVMIASEKKLGYLSAFVRSTREPLIIGIVIIVIYLQVNVLNGSLGPILISLLFFYRALSSLMTMQAAWNNFLSVSGSLINMTEFNNWLSSNKETIGNAKFSRFVNNIKLEDVTFHYGENEILKGINLEIPKNETIAFVGESGSGKTTLVSIIAGLMPVEHGKMEIDNLDRNDFKISSFQERVGYISQDPVIFNDTIYNNVSFWAEPTAENKKKFEAALKKASAYDFVSNLEDKENTMLGNNGINLSGGQKQRISIARELYKDIDILILDEATSSLDSETEKAIQDNIENLKGHYTILIVAHRLSTIKNANRIVYMNKGKISNIGDFSELISQVPNFKRMVQLQELSHSA